MTDKQLVLGNLTKRQRRERKRMLDNRARRVLGLGPSDEQVAEALGLPVGEVKRVREGCEMTLAAIWPG